MNKIEQIKNFNFKPEDMELKAIKHYPSMSEETYCYEANLYILNVKICRVHNRGRGGADDFDFEEPTLLGRGFLTWKYVQEIDDWCKKNMPKWYFKYQKEKQAENEDDIFSYREYRAQYKMFLRQKYKDEKTAALKKKLGLD